MAWVGRRWGLGLGGVWWLGSSGRLRCCCRWGGTEELLRGWGVCGCGRLVWMVVGYMVVFGEERKKSEECEI